MASDRKDISTGKSFTLAMVDGQQNIFASVRLREYNPVVEYDAPESQDLDGITRRQSNVSGYKVSFEAERTNNFVDEFIAAQQANFLIGGVQYYVSVTETIQESDGKINQYIYDEVDVQFPELGNRNVKEFTIIKGNFHAATRTPSPANARS